MTNQALISERRGARELRDVEALPGSKAALISLTPIVLIALYAVLVANPSTRSFAKLLQQENQLIEWSTFLALFFGSLLSLYLAVKTKKRGAIPFITIFFAIAAFGLMIVSMEEIAWGQKIFGFCTPKAMAGVNAQGELTLHNIEGIHGKTQYLYLAFAVAGLVGISFSRARSRMMRLIAVPGTMASWFLLIGTYATILSMIKCNMLAGSFTWHVRQQAELIEFLIGSGALLYLLLVRKRNFMPLEIASDPEIDVSVVDEREFARTSTGG